MCLSKSFFAAIDDGIAKLNSPEVIWFRGHVENHTLLPVFYKVFKRLTSEYELVKKYLHVNGCCVDKDYNLFTLVEMHHNYFPTRLLSWTKSLHVALFCALVRESSNPCVFILDPVKLNSYSNVKGVFACAKDEDNEAIKHTQKENPIAIAVNNDRFNPSSVPELLTIHGKNPRGLQEQVPDCISKVLLTNLDKGTAWDEIISGKWL